jgi:hypothetical protein
MAQYDVNRVLFDLIRKPDRAEILKNLGPFLEGYRLSDAEKAALLDPGYGQLLALGALPNLVFKYYLWHGLPPGEYAARAAVNAPKSGS